MAQYTYMQAKVFIIYTYIYRNMSYIVVKFLILVLASFMST